MIMADRRPPAISTGNLWQGATIPPLQIKIVTPMPQVKVREYPDRFKLPGRRVIKKAILVLIRPLLFLMTGRIAGTLRLPNFLQNHD
jgi:hypothetical protein